MSLPTTIFKPSVKGTKSAISKLKLKVVVKHDVTAGFLFALRDASTFA